MSSAHRLLFSIPPAWQTSETSVWNSPVHIHGREWFHHIDHEANRTIQPGMFQNLYKCPLCSTTKFPPSLFDDVLKHYMHAHWKKRLVFAESGFVSYPCYHSCSKSREAHFHCGFCSDFFGKKDAIEHHVLTKHAKEKLSIDSNNFYLEGKTIVGFLSDASEDDRKVGCQFGELGSPLLKRRKSKSTPTCSSRGKRGISNRVEFCKRFEISVISGDDSMLEKIGSFGLGADGIATYPLRSKNRVQRALEKVAKPLLPEYAKYNFA